ncbi:hypothetical protein BD324DRAFT_650653 [Kockovaella imperatae]|uniref:Uncharacterized protein n=1 Tax=Kockovaella imperatae TaxID=4999 RepID=A0A1Y1UG83_9TREE|nr:hypothetical protein BD324DRAFT_650653 [Kockovaella imperatae]ORX37038.1 hypothetical protein BD324DRAFT_650653 [Kockovaella imperatae]
MPFDLGLYSLPYILLAWFLVADLFTGIMTITLRQVLVMSSTLVTALGLYSVKWISRHCPEKCPPLVFAATYVEAYFGSMIDSFECMIRGIFYFELVENTGMTIYAKTRFMGPLELVTQEDVSYVERIPRIYSEISDFVWIWLANLEETASEDGFEPIEMQIGPIPDAPWGYDHDWVPNPSID